MKKKSKKRQSSNILSLNTFSILSIIALSIIAIVFLKSDLVGRSIITVPNEVSKPERAITTQGTPTGLNVTCGAGSVGSGGGKVMANLVWRLVSGATSYAIRIDDQNEDTLSTISSDCANFRQGDFCTKWNGDASYSAFETVAGHSYKWWVQACNSAGCSAPTEAPIEFRCNFPYGGVTLTPKSIVSSLPITTIRIGETFKVDFNIPQVMIPTSQDQITFAKDGVAINSLDFGQNTIVSTGGSMKGSVTISAPIILGTYSIRYYRGQIREDSPYLIGSYDNFQVTS